MKGFGEGEWDGKKKTSEVFWDFLGAAALVGGLILVVWCVFWLVDVLLYIVGWG